ncbi:MAG: aspartate aminotransferase family protein [Spirochaetaceae bacterium]|nr:MAG: aspartate aminotransferase family protein [Spirochaetaceae bacterium]
MTDASRFSGGHCLPRNYAEELLIIDRGSGVWLYDRGGNRYLDMGSGIAVNALGYGREDLAEIASAQMRKVIHVSNLYTTEPTLQLARHLADAQIGAWNPDFGAVHFGNSGAEANEAAIKYARVYAQRTHGPQKHKLLGFHNGFHGRTLGALSLTYTPKYRTPFEPLLPGCVFAPFNDGAALEAALDDSFAGVIVEVVQGEGGLACMTPQFAESLNRLCRKHKVLLIADEVQTGLGRTGNLFGSEAVGLHPDIVSLSKPLGGGLPLSATLINRRINDVLEIGDHGTTFGGGPVTAAVALRVWQIIADPAFLVDVRHRASHLEHCLRELARRFDFTGQPCGMGLLRGLPVQAAERRLPDVMTAILTAARDRGLLLLRSGSNVIRIAPPLVISEREIDEGCAILESSLRAVATQFKGELHE